MLLQDNTIGHVQQISDPRVAQLDSLVSGRDPTHRFDPAPLPTSTFCSCGMTPFVAATIPATSVVAGKVVLKHVKESHSALAQGSLVPTGGPGGGDWGLQVMDDDQQQLLRALSSGLGGASACAAPAAAGRDDLALWREFEELQASHGEAVCGAILEDCGNDFEAAIRTIRGQSAAAGGSTAIEDAWASPGGALEGWESPAGATPPGSPFRGVGQGGESAQSLSPAARRETERVREVRALAEVYRVPEAAAQELCATLPQVAPAAAVEALSSHGGDVDAAAMALIMGRSEEDAGGKLTGSPGGAGRAAGRGESAAAAAVRALTGADPARVVALRQLAELFPSVPEAVASAVLAQHGGSCEAAARALAEGMAAEPVAARGAGPSGGRLAAVAPLLCGQLSEEDQLAMLRAMGELEDEGAPTQQHWQHQQLLQQQQSFQNQRPQQQTAYGQPAFPSPVAPSPPCSPQQRAAAAPVQAPGSPALPAHLRLLEASRVRTHEVPTEEGWGRGGEGGAGRGRGGGGTGGAGRGAEAPMFSDAELEGLSHEQLM